MPLSSFFQRLQQAVKSFSNDEVEHGPVADDDGIIRADTDWKAQARHRRVEIMVTGDPSRVSAVADAIDVAQKHILKDAKEGQKIESRVTAFLDGCIHRSRWSKKVFQTAAKARRMHCEQSKTKFADAFANSSGEIVDDIILIGHRFDDDFKEALDQAERLKEQGVHIHCFHTGADTESREAYEALAEKTGGVFLQLTDQSQLNQVMPILMNHLNDQDKMEALTSNGRQELLEKLKAQLLTSPNTPKQTD